MKQEKSKKKGIIIVGVSAILLSAILGVSFAIWNYSRVGNNQILVAGDVYMKFKETPALTIENAIPSEGPGENDYFEFTIEGKNTYSKPIWYEIDLQYGEDHATRKTRIKDSLLKFRLVEIKDGSEQTVVDNASYNNLTNKKIWINTIAANTRSKVEITYRLYMWISSDTIIGNTSDAVYDMETWNNDIFASIKVNVTGDFNEKELESGSIGVDTLKETVGKLKGMIGVTNDNKLVTEDNGNIREWRYSGADVNNYVYFNCKDMSNQTNDTCELWRVIGVFKDESEVEHIKIVRNEVLSETKVWDSSDTSNNWEGSEVEKYLNTEYYETLTVNAKNMIEESKYYLGNFGYREDYRGQGIVYTYDSDTAIEAYKHERGNIMCDAYLEGNSYSEFGNGDKNCNIWFGNQSTWTGLIGLIYPSDLGYSMLESEWNKVYSFEDPTDEIPKEKEIIDFTTSWFYNKDSNEVEVLVSPSSRGNRIVTDYSANGSFSGLTSDLDNSYSIRPTLYLENNVKIIAGDGSQSTPYELS